jgi:uncharacterized membrane protein YccC
MRRFTVMGFTEAELGFVIAALFAAIAISERTDTENRAAATRALEKQRDSVALAFKAYRDSVRKRSNKTPRCTEKGEPPGPIAELRVLGRDLYAMQGERLTSSQVIDRLSPWIAKSKDLGCHYLVRTIATSGVDGPAHSAAVRRLWARFDVDDRDR